MSTELQKLELMVKWEKGMGGIAGRRHKEEIIQIAVLIH